MMDTHALHGQLHEVVGSKVVRTETAASELHTKSELHSHLHHVSVASVFGLEHRVQRMQARIALST
jgi:hypothetical protein